MNSYSTDVKVLVVTSVREHAKAIITALKNIGLQKIKLIESGLSALSLLSQEEWGLVICDQEMKQIDGWLFVKEYKLSEKIPNHPAILLGKGEAPEKEEILKKYGLIRYLKMPVKASELIFDPFDSFISEYFWYH